MAEAVRPLLETEGVPGVAVGTTAAGEMSWFNFGVTSAADQRPVTDDTLFEVGSISKTFTATLFSHAEAQGRISGGDHPSKYVPGLRGAPIDDATMIQLGTYTAGGLPLQFPPDVSGDDGLMGYLRAWTATAPPGTMRRYSNPSIGLLGLATARALGRDFTDVMEGDLLPALSLRNTFIRIPPSRSGDYAWGHDADGRPRRVAPGVLDAQAYGIKTTARDLIRFVEVNLEPGRSDPDVARAICGTQVGYYRVGEMTQGLGWEQYAWPTALEVLLAGNDPAITGQPNPVTPLPAPTAPPGPTLFNKTGATGGFSAYVAFVPACRIGVVLLANRAIPARARITAVHRILTQLPGAVP